MTTIQPEGESIRKAVKWISDEQAYDGTKAIKHLIESAALKFNLSPKETEYLVRFFKTK
jgi:hypothetical protein